jgi:Predicted nucleotide kinase
MNRNLHIFLTGQPAVGKTTIIKNILQDVKSNQCISTNLSIRGFYTEECREDQHEQEQQQQRRRRRRANSEKQSVTSTDTTDNNTNATNKIQTQERANRKATKPGGRRIGFDIVYFMEDDGSGTTSTQDHPPMVSLPKRQPLSRLSERPISKKCPHVGNYLVNIENVEKYAVPTLLRHKDAMVSNDGSLCQRNELVILDEVGKMELLCPAFLPAVNQLLDESLSENSHDVALKFRKRIVLGTLPTPRYGRVIPAVESIKKRNDVIVLHVTKSNRDELKCILLDTIGKWLTQEPKEEEKEQEKEGQEGCPVITNTLDRFLYHGGKDTFSSQTTPNNDVGKDDSSAGDGVDHGTFIQDIVLPCEPLYPNVNNNVHDTTAATIIPKVLLLGETASPQPSNKSYSYCERTMWTILGRIVGIDYSPIKNIHTATKDGLETFIRLKDKVLAKGICIWDVYATVHEDASTRTERSIVKRQKVTQQGARTNDIVDFLQKHPSIQKIVFIGKKAHASFVRHFSLPDTIVQHNISMVIVPSSSPANTKMTINEKVQEWKKALEEE